MSHCICTCKSIKKYLYSVRHVKNKYKINLFLIVFFFQITGANNSDAKKYIFKPGSTGWGFGTPRERQSALIWSGGKFEHDGMGRVFPMRGCLIAIAYSFLQSSFSKSSQS